MRKAISVATITLEITTSIVPNLDDPAKAPVTRIVVNQTATGGIKSVEKRTTDWRERPHTDRIFGSIEGQSRLVRGSASGSGEKVRPTLDVQTVPKEDKIVQFLRGEIDLDGNPDEGFLVDENIEDKDGLSYGEGEGLWLQSWVKTKEEGWTAEQVCAFFFFFSFFLKDHFC